VCDCRSYRQVYVEHPSSPITEGRAVECHFALTAIAAKLFRPVHPAPDHRLRVTMTTALRSRGPHALVTDGSVTPTAAVAVAGRVRQRWEFGTRSFLPPARLACPSVLVFPIRRRRLPRIWDQDRPAPKQEHSTCSSTLLSSRPPRLERVTPARSPKKRPPGSAMPPRRRRRRLFSPVENKRADYSD